MPDAKAAKKEAQRGFSLVELMVAMTISIVIIGIASTLLASSIKIRTRENARTESIADVQRALNTMSREIAIGGYGFDPSSNGLVVEDCDASSLRVRSNLNRYTSGSTTIESEFEDIKYLIDSTDDLDYLVRYDRHAAVPATVLANRISNLEVIYWSPANTVLDVAADPSQVANAVAVRITVSVDLPEIGAPGSPGYQPETTIQLTSDVTLRNKSQNLTTF